MKVAYYSGTVGQVKTGVGIHITNLLRQMIAIRSEIEFTSFLPSIRNAQAHKISVKHLDPSGHIFPCTVPVPSGLLHLSQTYLRVPPMTLLLGQDYDVYHQMWVNTDPVVPSNKLIVSMHDTVSLCWPRDEASLFARASRLLRRAAAVITVSEFSKQRIMEAFALSEKHIHVIYNGCDHNMFHSRYPDADVRVRLTQLGISQPYILYIGGQAPRKNLTRLIEAFAEARRSAGLAHTLVLVGPLSKASAELQEAIVSSECGDAIRLIGYVPDDAVPYLYRGSDLLLFPSLYEGFGLPVIEAMACGTPVVTSTTTSLSEVAGDAALLVDPNSVESIVQGILKILAEDEEEQSQRRARGILRASTFSWSRCAEQHLTIYDEVANNSSLT